MDGPAVNHKFYESLRKQREESELPKMMDIGSCNLHILHGSFKAGIESMYWEVRKLLKSSCQFLHDSLGWRAYYISLTNSTEFSFSFYSTRWIEDKPGWASGNMVPYGKSCKLLDIITKIKAA